MKAQHLVLEVANGIITCTTKSMARKLAGIGMNTNKTKKWRGSGDSLEIAQRWEFACCRQTIFGMRSTLARCSRPIGNRELGESFGVFHPGPPTPQKRLQRFQRRLHRRRHQKHLLSLRMKMSPVVQRKRMMMRLTKIT